jgi:hypothetical protein
MLSGLYYKPMTIVNDDSRVVISLNLHLQTTLESSFTIVTCLLYRPLVSTLPISRPFFGASANGETRTLNLGMMRRGFNPCATAASLVSYYVLIAVGKDYDTKRSTPKQWQGNY